MGFRRGAGRTLPATDSTNDGQVVIFDSTKSYGVRVGSNGERKVVSVNSAYTPNPGEIVLVDTTSAGVTITLPAPLAPAQANITVIREAGSNAVTVAPASGTVDGASSVTISATYSPKAYNTDQTNYFTVA